MELACMRMHAHTARRLRAVTMIQKHWRGYVVRRQGLVRLNRKPYEPPPAVPIPDEARARYAKEISRRRAMTFIPCRSREDVENLHAEAHRLLQAGGGSLVTLVSRSVPGLTHPTVRPPRGFATA